MSLASLPPAAPALSPGHVGLTRKRKAAMIVQMALTEGATLPISDLPDDMQLDLTRELGAIRLVDRATLSAVAEEFLRNLEGVGLALPGGIDNALSFLGDRISPAAAARARSESAAQKGVDPWTVVLNLEPETLVPVMERESTEVAAVLLSKLPVAKAADLLGRLPGERARRITYAVSQTADVSPDAVQRIGAALAAEYGIKAAVAFGHPPVQRIGAILNSSPAATRDAVLEGLGTEDPEFALKVRRAIFTFPDIPSRLRALDVPGAIRTVDQADLVTALAAGAAAGGDEAAAVDYILANMSQRMADALREEMDAKGKVRPADAEKAWGAVVTAIRTKADAGEISLAEPAEDDDEDA